MPPGGFAAHCGSDPAATGAAFVPSPMTAAFLSGTAPPLRSAPFNSREDAWTRQHLTTRALDKGPALVITYR
jgi:hypothetical protein